MNLNQADIERLEVMFDLLGYKRAIFKSDQEPAIVELKREVVRTRPEEIVLEESPVEDSRSNGYIERAIQPHRACCIRIKES